MSPFDFGKNFLEEQFAVIESLENRIIAQELTLEEFIESFDVLVRNIQSKEHLQIVLEKITHLDMTVEVKRHVQEILIQLHESKVIQKVSSSLDQKSVIDFAEIPESQAAPAENIIDASINKDSIEVKEETPEENFSIKPSIQVYDEWTEADSIYDAGEWYEGISFTTNIEETNTDTVNTLVQLEEDIQDTAINTDKDPTDFSYEGIQVVVAAKEIAESLRINQYEISEELSQDSFPYEYVDSIISRAKGISVSKDVEKIPSHISEKLEDYNESNINTDTEISQIENTHLLNQSENIQDINIQSPLENVEEVITNLSSVENQDIQFANEAMKIDGIEEPLVEIGLNENIEMIQEKTPLIDESEFIKEPVCNEVADIQDIRDVAEEIQEQIQESTTSETPDDTAELTDIRDVLEFTNTQNDTESTNTIFDTISSFKTPAILEKKVQKEFQEHQVQIMEDTQKEVQEELLREAYNEMQEELEVQKPLEANINTEIPKQIEELEVVNTQKEEIQEELEAQKPLEASINTEITEQLEDLGVVNTQKEEIPKSIEKPAQNVYKNTPSPSLQNNTKTDYWWANYPVLEYPEIEDFGLFILYRDLG